MAKKRFETLFSFPGLETMVSKTDKLNKNLEKTNLYTKNNTFVMNAWKKSAIDVSQGAKNIGESFKKFTGSDVLEAPIKGFTKSLGGALGKGKGFFASITAGVKGFIGAAGGLKGVIGLIGGVTNALVAAAFPLAAIVGAIFLVEKAFENNLGGIATEFSALFGQVKDIFGKVNVGINKMMKALSPLFSLVFKPLFTALRGIMFLVEGFLDGVFEAFQPLGVVLSEIGEQFREIFGLGKSNESLFIVLKSVGKILGLTLKAAMMPVVLSFKVLLGIVKFLAPAFKAIGAIVTPIFKAIWAVLKPIVEAIKFITGYKNKTATQETQVAKTNTSLSAQEASLRRRAVNQTSNNNVTINTSREISPASAPQIGNIISGNLRVQRGVY